MYGESGTSVKAYYTLGNSDTVPTYSAELTQTLPMHWLSEVPPYGEISYPDDKGFTDIETAPGYSYPQTTYAIRKITLAISSATSANYGSRIYIDAASNKTFILKITSLLPKDLATVYCGELGQTASGSLYKNKIAGQTIEYVKYDINSATDTYIDVLLTNLSYGESGSVIIEFIEDANLWISMVNADSSGYLMEKPYLAVLPLKVDSLVLTELKEQLAVDQGFTNYAQMVTEYQSLGSTVITGGHINTGLIESDVVVAEGIAAKTIDAQNATFENLNVRGRLTAESSNVVLSTPESNAEINPLATSFVYAPSAESSNITLGPPPSNGVIIEFFSLQLTRLPIPPISLSAGARIVYGNRAFVSDPIIADGTLGFGGLCCTVKLIGQAGDWWVISHSGEILLDDIMIPHTVI